MSISGKNGKFMTRRTICYWNTKSDWIKIKEINSHHSGKDIDESSCEFEHDNDDLHGDLHYAALVSKSSLVTCDSMESRDSLPECNGCT